MKPTLFMMLGVPGSGKTYFAERFAKERRAFHLNSDRLRLEMFANPTYTRPEHERVFQVMDYIAEQLLAAGIDVVYDANSNKRIHRARLRNLARRQKARSILFHIVTPRDIARRRLTGDRQKKRTGVKAKLYRPIPLHVFYRMQKEIQMPLSSEHPMVIDGTQPYRKQVQSLKKKLR